MPSLGFFAVMLQNCDYPMISSSPSLKLFSVYKLELFGVCHVYCSPCILISLFFLSSLLYYIRLVGTVAYAPNLIMSPALKPVVLTNCSNCYMINAPWLRKTHWINRIMNVHPMGVEYPHACNKRKHNGCTRQC